MLPAVEMAPGCLATRPPQHLLGTAIAVALAGGTRLPPSGAARRTDSPPPYPSKSCPRATVPPAAMSAPIRCWSARPHPPGQTSTVPPTIWSAHGRTPPLWGAGSPARAATAALRHHRHDLVHLLHRQQPAVHAPVARLAAALPACRRPFRPRGCRGWVRRGRTRGVGRGLAEPGFQFADALLRGHILRAQRSVLPAERRQLLQQRGGIRSRSLRRGLGRQRSSITLMPRL